MSCAVHGEVVDADPQVSDVQSSDKAVAIKGIEIGEGNAGGMLPRCAKASRWEENALEWSAVVLGKCAALKRIGQKKVYNIRSFQQDVLIVSTREARSHVMEHECACHRDKFRHS